MAAMEAMMSQLVPIPERMEAGKLHYLHEEGVWYVHCKHCEVEKRLNARNEEEAYTGLHEWRLSMPNRKYQHRNWSCPRCAQYWQDTTPTATDTAEAASQLAPTTATTTDTAESASQEVQQLKAEVVQLNAELWRLKADVVELKFELKAEVHRHVAYRAAHDEDIQKLKQKVDDLTARVTAVPDDDPSLQEC